MLNNKYMIIGEH